MASSVKKMLKAGETTGVDGRALIEVGGQPAYRNIGDWVSGAEATEEDFTLTVDPATPSDPTVNSPITTQAEATTVGTFKTVPAAIDALPKIIRHTVTVEIAAGDHVLTGDFLGHLERFVFVPTELTGQGNWTTGEIVYTSVGGNVRETATSTYAVASCTARQVILAADPGFSANEHQGKFLRVVSGTGAGQVRPIRNHTGTEFNHPGIWEPLLDGTSVVEVVRPATRVQDDPAANYGWAGLRGGGVYFPWVMNVVIRELELYTVTAGGQLAFDNLAVWFDHCRILFPGVAVTAGEVWIDGSVHDGQGMAGYVGWDGVSLLEFHGCRAWNNSKSGAMFRNSPLSGIAVGQIIAGATPSSIFLNGFVMDDLGGDGVRVSGKGNYVGFNPTNSTNTDFGATVVGFGVHVLNGGTAFVDVTTPNLFPTGAASGAAGIDEIAVTEADVLAAPDRTIIGPHLSVITEGSSGI